MLLNMLARNRFPVLLQSPINAGAFAMLAGLVIVPLVSAFTRAPDREMVEAAFYSYERLGYVPAKQALED
jgi:hypothetical protein